MNLLINTIFPGDILVFRNEDYDEFMSFLVISQNGGRLNVINLNDYNLQNYNCLYGDTLIKSIEDNENFHFHKKEVVIFNKGVQQ